MYICSFSSLCPFLFQHCVNSNSGSFTANRDRGSRRRGSRVSWDHPAFEHLVGNRRRYLIDECGAHLWITAQRLYASCSIGGFGSFFCCHNCSQVDCWYFWMTFWAIISK